MEQFATELGLSKFRDEAAATEQITKWSPMDSLTLLICGRGSTLVKSIVAFDHVVLQAQGKPMTFDDIIFGVLNVGVTPEPSHIRYLKSRYARRLRLYGVTTNGNR